MRWAAFLTQSLRHLFMLTVCLACSTVFCSYAFYTAKEQPKHAPGPCSINTGEKTPAKPWLSSLRDARPPAGVFCQTRLLWEDRDT